MIKPSVHFFCWLDLGPKPIYRYFACLYRHLPNEVCAARQPAYRRRDIWRWLERSNNCPRVSKTPRTTYVLPGTIVDVTPAFFIRKSSQRLHVNADINIAPKHHRGALLASYNFFVPTPFPSPPTLLRTPSTSCCSRSCLLLDYPARGKRRSCPFCA